MYFKWTNATLLFGFFLIVVFNVSQLETKILLRTEMMTHESLWLFVLDFFVCVGD
jgi:hypothetical protein